MYAIYFNSSHIILTWYELFTDSKQLLKQNSYTYLQRTKAGAKSNSKIEKQKNKKNREKSKVT